MRNVILSLLTGMGILCALSSGFSQEFKQHVSKEFTLSKDAGNSIVYIYNMSGFIKVEGYAGDKVLMEMDETISSEDNANLETGKKEFKLAFEQNADTILAYIAAPYDSRPHRHWHYSDDRDEIQYQYIVDFTLKVPFNMNLHISTVNDGKITVNNVSGNLHVSNVNDEISITNAKSTTYAHTVNGDVTVIYLANPPELSSYSTINGNIRVTYQPNLSADLEFKSMQGDFFTDFPNVELLPATVIKTRDKKDGSIVYKLNASTAVRFGKGGKTFKFETLNGNIYIKKQS